MKTIVIYNNTPLYAGLGTVIDWWKTLKNLYPRATYSEYVKTQTFEGASVRDALFGFDIMIWRFNANEEWEDVTALIMSELE